MVTWSVYGYACANPLFWLASIGEYLDGTCLLDVFCKKGYRFCGVIPIFNVHVAIDQCFIFFATSRKFLKLSCLLYFYGDGCQSCQYADGFIRHRAVRLCYLWVFVLLLVSICSLLYLWLVSTLALHIIAVAEFLLCISSSGLHVSALSFVCVCVCVCVYVCMYEIA